MSLDHFKSTDDVNVASEETSEQNESEPTDNKPNPTWGDDWHIYPGGYWEDVDEDFFGEGTPNSPPLINVDTKLAAEVHITEDQGVVEEAAEFMFPEEVERYTQAVQIIYNDLSTWLLPLPPWGEDLAGTRDWLVRDIVPEVIQWEAILDGRDPEKALSEWEDGEGVETTWTDMIDETEMSDEDRKELNNKLGDNIDLPERVRKSKGINISEDSTTSWAEML